MRHKEAETKLKDTGKDLITKNWTTSNTKSFSGRIQDYWLLIGWKLKERRSEVKLIHLEHFNWMERNTQYSAGPRVNVQLSSCENHGSSDSNGPASVYCFSSLLTLTSAAIFTKSHNVTTGYCRSAGLVIRGDFAFNVNISTVRHSPHLILGQAALPPVPQPLQKTMFKGFLDLFVTLWKFKSYTACLFKSIHLFSLFFF